MLYAGACRASILLFIVSSNLLKSTSYTLGNAVTKNLADTWGGKTVSEGWVFMLLDSDGF